jgi:hypothetical protein
MWIYNGKRIREGRSWKDSDGITHPTSWGRWSDAEKTSKGMVWVDPAPSFDNRFWWDASTPKALEDVNAVDEDGNPVLEDGEQVVILGLKSQAIATVKQQAAGLLAPTDWYVTRKAETDVAIPSEILTYRQSVREASGAIEASISSVTTHEDFIALYDAPVDAKGIPTGNPPIADWPMENI